MPPKTNKKPNIEILKEQNIQTLENIITSKNALEENSNYSHLEKVVIERISAMGAKDSEEFGTMEKNKLESFAQKIIDLRKRYGEEIFTPKKFVIDVYESFFKEDLNKTTDLNNTINFKNKYLQVTSPPAKESLNLHKEDSTITVQPKTSNDDVLQRMKDHYESKYRKQKYPEEDVGSGMEEKEMPGGQKCLKFRFDTPDEAAQFLTSMAQELKIDLKIIDPQTNKVIAHINSSGKITQDGPNGKPIDSPQALADLLREKNSAVNKNPSDKSQEPEEEGAVKWHTP